MQKSHFGGPRLMKKHVRNKPFDIKVLPNIFLTLLLLLRLNRINLINTISIFIIFNILIPILVLTIIIIIITFIMITLMVLLIFQLGTDLKFSKPLSTKSWMNGLWACAICHKTVAIRHNAVSCNDCNKWAQISCNKITMCIYGKITER